MATPTRGSTCERCRCRTPDITSRRSASGTALKVRRTYSTREPTETWKPSRTLTFASTAPPAGYCGTTEGETYTKHYYPPNLRNLEFTPDSLIGEMDYAGIDMTLLHTNAMLGRSNEYQAECVRRFPDRLLSMATVDERLIHTDVDSVIASVTSAVRDLGLHAIKFSAGGYIVSDEPWDSGPYAPFWEAVSTLGVPVFFTLVTGPARAREAGPDPEGQRGYLRRATHPHAPHGALPADAMQPHSRLPLARVPGRRSHLTCRTRYGSRSRTRV